MGYKFVIPRLAQGSVPTAALHRDFHAVVLQVRRNIKRAA